MKKISVIMPAYRKAKVIGNVLRETEKALKWTGLPYEIIVVDDASLDGTRKKASSYKSDHVKVVGYNKNRGKGGAIKYGFQYVTGDIVAFMDADMDLHPDQLQHFLYYMSISDADAVIGSKVHPLSSVKYPLKRKILSYGYRMMNKALFGLSVHDTQVGQKVFKKKVLDDVLPRVLVKRYAFDLELLVVAHNLGYKIVEAPVKLNYDFSGSGVNLGAIWKIFVDTSAIFYRLRIMHYYNGGKK